MTDKQIIIDGVDVSGCDELWLNFEKNYNSKCIRFKDVYSQCSYCKDNPNCEYKQLQKEKFENLNNRQIVESAENLIYENSELYKNLKEKEQECESLKEEIEVLKDNFDTATRDCNELIEELKHECEKLKKQLETSEKWRIKAESLNENFELKNTSYHKALEEIEEYCNNVLNFTAVRTTESDILDIISKVKGEIMEIK